MSDTEVSIDGLALVLAWSQAMGADAAVCEDAIDWCARGSEAPGSDFIFPGRGIGPQHPSANAAAQGAGTSQPSTALTRQPMSQPPRSPATARPAAVLPGVKPAVRPARVEAANLLELEAKLRAFDGCGLKVTATNLCFYRGAPSSKLMIIGEAPGRDEDIEGRPFVGRAGQLLDKMLAAIGMSENQVHITNIVYWRPPGNRTPSPQEALACRPFLERQVELVAPDVVLLLGGSASKHILDTEEGILRLRGRWFDAVLGTRPVKIMATLHPAYLLRTPASKRQVWRDLLAVKDKLK
ncbi:MAG: uracil-DNA glycosylase [Hyphomicrobium sp.]